MHERLLEKLMLIWPESFQDKDHRKLYDFGHQDVFINPFEATIMIFLIGGLLCGSFVSFLTAAIV